MSEEGHTLNELQEEVRRSLKKVTDRGSNLSLDQQISMSFTEIQGQSAIGLANALDALRRDTLAAAERVEQKLDAHAKVLSNASKSSDRHAGGIARATWVLAIFTAVLAVATLLMAYRETAPPDAKAQNGPAVNSPATNDSE